MARTSLSSRPLDAAWVFYLLLHIVPAVLFDSQSFLPRKSFPLVLQQTLDAWLAFSEDPLLTNVNRPGFVWIKTFLGCELFLQVPFCVLASVMLQNGNSACRP